MTISGDVLVHRVAGILNEQGKPPHDSTILGAISKLSWYEMEHICEFDRASKSAESPGTVPPVGAANNRSDEIALQLETALAYARSGIPSNIGMVKNILTGCIAQLRAVR